MPLKLSSRPLKKAGPEAIGNVELFKQAMTDFTMKNPFLKEEKQLKYVGAAYFNSAAPDRCADGRERGQRRQIPNPFRWQRRMTVLQEMHRISTTNFKDCGKFGETSAVCSSVFRFIHDLTID